jgi:hypothetical protein
MPCNKKNKWVFIHIPKTGGTSIQHSLSLNDQYVLNPNKFPVPQHLPLMETCARFNLDLNDAYFVFSIIRNPYSKLISEYMWNPDFKNGTFDALIAHAENIVDTRAYSVTRFGDHFRPQCEFFNHDYNVQIVRFENFESDWNKHVEPIVGLSYNDIGVANFSTYKCSIEISQNQRKRIHKIYKNDFKRFGYNWKTQPPRATFT